MFVFGIFTSHEVWQENMFRATRYMKKGKKLILTRNVESISAVISAHYALSS